MLRTIAASGVAIATSLIIAQAAGAQEAAAPADTMTPAPETAAPAPEAAGPADAAPAPAAQPAPAANPQVVAFVDQEFPQADTDGDGKLSEAEFKAWITKLKLAELQAQNKPVVQAEVDTYATNAFAMADKDTDKLVDKNDLVTFFNGG